MAVTEKDINKLLKQINGKPLEDTHFKWTSEPLEAFPSYTVSSGGTSDSMYGAVPNVTIGGSTMSATGINVTLGSGTSANAVWTTTGTGTGPGGVWQTVNPYTIMGTGTTVEQGGKISVKGEGADIDLNGKSLKTWMEKVEQRLNILTPNPELEKEWDDLRRLGERYRKLEKKCQEKADMWKKLKSMPKPNITR